MYVHHASRDSTAKVWFVSAVFGHAAKTASLQINLKQTKSPSQTSKLKLISFLQLLEDKLEHVIAAADSVVMAGAW